MNEEILNFSQLKMEPEWLLNRRQAAFEQVEKLELPLIERVRFNKWKLENTRLVSSEIEGNVPDFTELPSHPFLVQVGSNTVFEQTTPELENKGVVFTDFHAAMFEIPELIEQHFGTVVPDDDSKLSAANTAAFNSGVVLYVPENVTIEAPIETLFMHDAASNVPMTKRVLIIAGKNSKFSYLERLQKIGEGATATTANIIVEIVAEAGSQIKFAALDQLGENVAAYVNRRAVFADTATIDWSLGAMNDGNVIYDLDSNLVGNGSHSNLKVVGVSTGKQTQVVDTQITNIGKNTSGHILQNGVALDKGVLTFNAIGKIERGAHGADSQQKNRVLMLSDKARGDVNPILLIDENDVTAGHAASVGQVDEEDLFYLQSRGLDEETAKRLVIRGFLAGVVSEIPVASVQSEFIDTIERKLGM